MERPGNADAPGPGTRGRQENHRAPVTSRCSMPPANSRSKKTSPSTTPLKLHDPLTDHLPPQNREAEHGILGGILRDPNILPAVRDNLLPTDFYYDSHQKIFQAMCD